MSLTFLLIHGTSLLDRPNNIAESIKGNN